MAVVEPDSASASERPSRAPHGDTSSSDERDRLVAETLAHVDVREAVYRRPLPTGPAHWKGVLALIFLMAAGVAAVAPPAWLSGGPPPEPDPDALARGARVMLYLQSRDVEAFRLTRGRLPSDLDEIGGGLPGIRYVRSNDRVYQLVAYGPDHRAIVYDSTRPDTAFLRAARLLAPLAPRDIPEGGA